MSPNKGIKEIFKIMLNIAVTILDQKIMFTLLNDFITSVVGPVITFRKKAIINIENAVEPAA